MKLLTGVVVAMLIALSGCKSGKESKCEKGFAQMKEMTLGLASLFGAKKGGPLDEVFNAVKPAFMKTCVKLPDDAIDCLSDVKGKLGDPKCSEALGKLRRVMRGGPKPG